jgi:hypothetical protein
MTSEIWTDKSKDDTPEPPVTKEEALQEFNKMMDRRIFIERNQSTLMSEDQIIRLSKIKEYVGSHLT